MKTTSEHHNRPALQFVRPVCLYMCHVVVRYTEPAIHSLQTNYTIITKP